MDRLHTSTRIDHDSDTVQGVALGLFVEGASCSEPCGNGTWGYKCMENCTCFNGATCHHVTGECQCTEGWTGSTCTERSLDIPILFLKS